MVVGERLVQTHSGLDVGMRSGRAGERDASKCISSHDKGLPRNAPEVPAETFHLRASPKSAEGNAVNRDWFRQGTGLCQGT